MNLARKTFSEILADCRFDCKAEYERIYSLFYCDGPAEDTLFKNCDCCFLRYPQRGTCLSLSDFDKTFNFDFFDAPPEKTSDIDYLVSFCEYTYNLVLYLMNLDERGQFFLQHVKQVIDKIGYIENVKNGLVDFVPNKQEAIIAAESVDDANITNDILHYSHHSMKGNLEEKRKILFSFANYFEPKKNDLNNYNQGFASNLFFMFNEFSIRHEKEKKNALLAEATYEKLEEYYDLTYELCLTAFSILGGMKSNEKVKEMRKKLKK